MGNTIAGVDIGTTFSAAAVSGDDGVSVFELGERIAAAPTVVVLSDSGGVLVGEVAERRSRTAPERSAREFKRRLGDSTPLLVGGTPYGAESLIAEVLMWVRQRIVERLGATPDGWVLSHPANWGPHKLGLLHEAARIATISNVTFVSEPVAAAVYYASRDRFGPGETVGVFDLGGGTLDATIVAWDPDGGFRVLGEPQGLDRFGGIDLDVAVFGHVQRSLNGAIEELDQADLANVAAIAQLRDECRMAKEALSADTDVTIPVALPNVYTQVRLTRAEFEDLIRPRLRDAVAAFERAITSSGLGMTDLSRVLLVGGSSRIPLVADMLREATGVPIALDAHPKHATCMGAALWGSRIDGSVLQLGTAAMMASPMGLVEPDASKSDTTATKDDDKGIADQVASRPEGAGSGVADVAADEPEDRRPEDDQPGGFAALIGSRTAAIGVAAAIVILLAAVAGLAASSLGDGDNSAGPEQQATTNMAGPSDEDSASLATTESTEATVPGQDNETDGSSPTTSTTMSSGSDLASTSAGSVSGGSRSATTTIHLGATGTSAPPVTTPTRTVTTTSAPSTNTTQATTTTRATTTTLATTTSAPGTEPSAPTQLHVKSRSGDTVTMGIVDNATDETGFRIYLAGSLHKQVGANSTTFSVTPELCTTVAVTVTAVNQYGESSPSNTINVNQCPSPPNAPSGLYLSAWSDGTASMGFRDNSSDEDGFRVYVNGSAHATLSANVSTFTITPTPCETWSVFVRAFEPAGESEATNTLKINNCP